MAARRSRRPIPPSEIYHFKPLDERVEVYQKPFRLVQDVTILATPEAQKLLAGMKPRHHQRDASNTRRATTSFVTRRKACRLPGRF